jgi:hypothetical protein
VWPRPMNWTTLSTPQCRNERDAVRSAQDARFREKRWVRVMEAASVAPALAVELQPAIKTETVVKTEPADLSMFALAQVAGRFEAGANRVLAPLGQPPEQPSAPPPDVPARGDSGADGRQPPSAGSSAPAQSSSPSESESGTDVGAPKDPKPRKYRPRKAPESFADFASLDVGDRNPLGTTAGDKVWPPWELPGQDGVAAAPFRGPLGDRATQGREARHWVAKTNVRSRVPLDLLTTGELRRRPAGWTSEASDDPDPGYMWPLLTYAQTRTRSTRSANAARAEKRKLAKVSRDPSAYCGHRFMCEVDMEAVKKKARAWTEENFPGRLLMANVVPLVLEVLRERPEAERSKRAQALVELAERDMDRALTGLDESGKVLFGDGSLHKMRGKMRRAGAPPIASAVAAVAAQAAP